MNGSSSSTAMANACPVCSGRMVEAFTSVVLERHEATYDRCPGCGLLQVRAPHWLDEAYASPIASTDTGLVARNLDVATRLAALLPALGRGWEDARYLDAAGGYGMLTRRMRDIGFDFVWDDPYTPNLLASGFEFDGRPGVRAVTAFEVLEHVTDPVGFVRGLMERSGAEHLICTTELYAGELPPPDWWYYSRETGQHITFYQHRTLAALAEVCGLTLARCGPLLILSRRPLSGFRLRVAESPARRLFAAQARRRLTSRTMNDHFEMRRRLSARTEDGDRVPGAAGR